MIEQTGAPPHAMLANTRTGRRSASPGGLRKSPSPRRTARAESGRAEHGAQSLLSLRRRARRAPAGRPITIVVFPIGYEDRGRGLEHTGMCEPGGRHSLRRDLKGSSSTASACRIEDSALLPAGTTPAPTYSPNRVRPRRRQGREAPGPRRGLTAARRAPESRLVGGGPLSSLGPTEQPGPTRPNENRCSHTTPSIRRANRSISSA